MTNAGPDPRERDAPKEDVLDQQRPTVPEEDGREDPFELPVEANEADVAEQRLPVPDDEEYPREQE